MSRRYESLKMLPKGYKINGSINISDKSVFAEQRTLVILVIGYTLTLFYENTNSRR